MESYKELYFKLFDSTTKAIEILQQAQRETEEIYIANGKDGETMENEGLSFANEDVQRS